MHKISFPFDDSLFLFSTQHKIAVGAENKKASRKRISPSSQSTQTAHTDAFVLFVEHSSKIHITFDYIVLSVFCHMRIFYYFSLLSYIFYITSIFCCCCCCCCSASSRDCLEGLRDFAQAYTSCFFMSSLNYCTTNIFHSQCMGKEILSYWGFHFPYQPTIPHLICSRGTIKKVNTQKHPPLQFSKSLKGGGWGGGGTEDVGNI